MDIASSSTTNQLSVGKKIISIIMDDKKVEINSEVFHIDNYEVSNSRDMKEGIYIVNQFNLDEEAIVSWSATNVIEEKFHHRN